MSRRNNTLRASTRDSYKALSFISTKDLSSELLSVFIYPAGEDSPQVEKDVSASLGLGVAAGQSNTVALDLVGNAVDPGTYFMVVRDSQEVVYSNSILITGPDAKTLRKFTESGGFSQFIALDDEGNVAIDDEGNVVIS